MQVIYFWYRANAIAVGCIALLATFGFSIFASPSTARGTPRWRMVVYAAGTIAGMTISSISLTVGAVNYAVLVRRRRRHATGLCPACGYDLRASKDRCPECGREFTTADVSPEPSHVTIDGQQESPHERDRD